MNPPPSPGLLAVIRLLLQRIEGSSYPNQDPRSIENLKAHLCCRIAELKVAEGKELPSPEAGSRNTAAWQQAIALDPLLFRVQMKTGRFGTDQSHHLS